jgi:putative CocE/NonD family hydrolase
MVNMGPFGGLTERWFGDVLDRVLGLGQPRSSALKITRNLRVSMPDGVRLATDHYRPAGIQRGPVVLVRTPYGKHTPLGAAYGHAFARRGLQVVVQDVRGTFGSHDSDDFTPFVNETKDGLAALAWLRRQPWCDGRVAMAGASYLGYTQWAIAPYADPKLSAIGLGITASNFRPTFYPGNSVALQLALAWSSGIGTQEARLPLRDRLTFRRRVTEAMSTLPAARADLAAIGRHVQFLTSVLEHAEPTDSYWDLLDHGTDLAGLGTPASFVAGWYDIFLARQLQDFVDLQRAGVPSRITVGPWWHGQLSSMPTMFRDQVDWLAGHLLDDKAMLQRPAVRIFLQKADRWLDFDRWPVPATELVLYPDIDRRLRREIPTGEGIRAFRYDPSDPTPLVGGAPLNIPGGQRDNRRVEARDDVLVYDGEPLTEDVDVIGSGSAQVFVRTEHPDADVFVRVCDVDPRGRSLNVVEGIRRLRPDDQAADDLGTRTAQVELWPTAYRFHRGHRIRVQISGGGFPNYIRNHQTGEPIISASHSVPGRTQILHGPSHPTKIMLPKYTG